MPWEPTIYVGGTFDLFHLGHVNFLRAASRIGRVVVGLNSDEFTARYKRTPVCTYAERKACLDACKYVERVVLNEGDEDSKPSILASRAEYIGHGDDWTGESLMKQMGLSQEWLEEHNIGLIYVPYTRSISSSDIIQRCKER